MGSKTSPGPFNIQNIAIVGAGPSGVAAAKFLLAEKHFNHIQIYEQRPTVGGVWHYTPSIISDPNFTIPQTNPNPPLDRPIRLPVNKANVNGSKIDQSAEEVYDFVSPLYDRLETNIPKQLMKFSDLDFPEEAQLFPQHDVVTAYLEEHANEVRHLIKFQTRVEDVRLSVEGGRDQWSVSTLDLRTGEREREREMFDAVVVANGHYNVPYVPKIEGIEEWDARFPGAISHSKFYRRPEEFRDKRVIVVGNNASGLDIGTQISTVCKHPLLQSQRSTSVQFKDLKPSPLKRELPEIARFITNNRGVEFVDGQVEENIDAVVFCTGYFYSYPFINGLKPPLTTTGTRTRELYQHVFYRPHPTLAILGLPQKVIPFPIAEVQTACVAKVWANRINLPSDDEMKAWEDRIVKKQGDSVKFHYMQFPEDADYILELYDWAMSAPPKEGLENDGNGKTPTVWREKERWLRERFAKIKQAFQDRGEGRHHVRTIEELGFDYDAWKREQGRQGKQLL